MAGNSGESLPDLNDIEGAYRFIKAKGLLKPYESCDECELPLRLEQSSEYPIFEAWTCINETCKKRSIEIESLKGSFFYQTPLFTLPRQIHCIKYWCDMQSFENTKKGLNIRQSTVENHFKKCRSFITKFFDSFPIELGGKDSHVAVEVRKLAYNDSVENFHLLMMIDTTKNPLIGYMQMINSEEINSTNISPVFSIIERVVRQHSVVACDWDESPPQVNVNITFISSCTNIQKMALKSYFDSHLKAITKIMVKREENPRELLNECMWRERFKDEAFENFIKHLQMFYNPSSVYL